MDRPDDKEKFLSSSQAAKHFGVCKSTIRKWDKNGIIKSYRIGGKLMGHRRFDITSFNGTIERKSNDSEKKQLDEHKINIEPKTKGAIYCRVSSSHQKDDLDRQIKSIQSIYPQYAIFKDIASGINYKRPSFLKLIEESIKGNISEIVVAHKDRFSRFGFEFFEWLLSQYGVKLLVLDNNKLKSDEQELAEDLLSIVHVFSCRQNGKRKYSTKPNPTQSDKK
jgi:putative resolvase